MAPVRAAATHSARVDYTMTPNAPRTHHANVNGLIRMTVALAHVRIRDIMAVNVVDYANRVHNVVEYAQHFGSAFVGLRVRGLCA